MKIRKTDIPNLDTRSKIEDALNIHASELEYRANIGNKAFTQHVKIRELYLHIQNGGEWEFIDKTLEEERDQEKLDAEEKAEQQKQDRIILAKTDGDVRDLLITELMNEAGFTPEKGSLALIQEKRDGKDFSQYWEDSASKLTEIKTMIAES